MIIVIHTNQVVVQVKSFKNIIDESAYLGKSLSKVWIQLCLIYKNEFLFWVSDEVREISNENEFTSILKNKFEIQSYGKTNPIDVAIGYIEQSPFLNINKKVKYPTWIMNDKIGGIHAEAFNLIYNKALHSSNFNELMCSIAKAGQPKGLLSYSNPNLLINKQIETKEEVTHPVNLFSFVKKHYKLQWVFILLFNILIYDKKFPILSFFKSLFVKKARQSKSLSTLYSQTKTISVTEQDTVDVLIPTIGRAQYLETVFTMLANQTHLPHKVIVVEQNAVAGAATELNFIYNKKWPFKVDHQLIYQLGACNARNLGLDKVESKYVFFADDDIEFANNFIETSLFVIKSNNFSAVNLACLQVGEKLENNNIMQWETFGSGCSIVETRCVIDLKYNILYEFGFGEDADFGMQLRNKGFDIIYLPNPLILHLKAPIGGFRTKHVQSWSKDLVLPKPSPTVMLFKQKYLTRNQLLGYKIVLFAKFYKRQSIKNPFAYIQFMNQRWAKSKYLANILNLKK